MADRAGSARRRLDDRERGRRGASTKVWATIVPLIYRAYAEGIPGPGGRPWGGTLTGIVLGTGTATLERCRRGRRPLRRPAGRLACFRAKPSSRCAERQGPEISGLDRAARTR